MKKTDLVHRDLSWLYFNERVLQEAENKDVPLYERLKFLAIFSSNLDEFYKVRISKLRRFHKFQDDVTKKLEEDPKAVVTQINEKVTLLQERFGKTFREDILPKLKKEDIHIVTENYFSEKQRAFVEQYFNEKVKQHVQVCYLDDKEDFSYLIDRNLFLFLDEEDGVLIPIPSDVLPRFIELPSENGEFAVTYLDDIIRANLNKEAYSVKITRDGELYFDEYEGELVEQIKESLSQREEGIPTRLLYDYRMPKELVEKLREKLILNETDLMEGRRYHNFSDFFSFPLPEGKEYLISPSLDPLPHPQLDNQPSVLEYIKQHDALLAYPYQKFDYVPKLLFEAAESDEIHSVSISLYRVTKKSIVADSLLKCLENGKKVTVFIEAKARFDEENNIYWGDKLKAAGANVLYSMPEIKVHSKIFLLEATNYKIAHVGTGNFNEKTAKLYTDFSLLSSRKELADDIKQVFMHLENPETYTPEPRQICISPFTARTASYEKIDREIELVKQGKKGLIFFKMNSLEDEGIIEKLYEASQAGVEVKLIVRGIFRLKPEVQGLSENIKAISVVGQFLEHPRIYLFGNDGCEEEVFIASADCMERNLDRRIEVAAPVFGKELKAILRKCLDLQWGDNVKARILDANQHNKFQVNNLPEVNSQLAFYHYLKDQL